MHGITSRSVRTSGRSVATIGAYDGVHLGHRQVISHVLSLAKADGLESVIVTFDRHPASVVRPASKPKLLTDLPQKLELLESSGVDRVVLVHFDEERAGETAEDFVESVLVAELAATVIVVGSDFHFGKARAGNVRLLEAMGQTHGFSVVPFELVADVPGGKVVSSTRIRGLIATGDLDGATALLGRPHEVRGEARAVQPGVAVDVPSEILLPPAGRYEVRFGFGADLVRATAEVPDASAPVLVRLSDAALWDLHLVDEGHDSGDGIVADTTDRTARVLFEPHQAGN